MTELYLDKGVGYMSVCVCQNRWYNKHPTVCKLYLNKKIGVQNCIYSHKQRQQNIQK